MTYLFTFLEGFASFISPCLLPLLPVYISYFAGSENKKSKAIANSISFVMGFSIVFILFAIVANMAGNTIIIYIKYVKIFFGILIIFLGLKYLDIFKLNIFKLNFFKLNFLNNFFSKFKGYTFKTKNLNSFKSLIFGMLFSISITPCIGTFLSSALLLIATEQNILKGLILIILYCMGLGLPFIISSILIDNLKNVFKIIKNNFKIVKIISGIILIIMGIYLIFF